MLRYRIKRAKKITPEFIDAMRIYLHVDGIDIDKLKQSCFHLKIYGMDISKFIKCSIDISYSDNALKTTDLFAFKDMLELYGPARIVTTPKMTFVDFKNIRTTIKNHLITNIKTNDSYWCPFELSNFEYLNDKLIKFIEHYGNGYTSKKFILHHYFFNENYCTLESAKIFHSSVVKNFETKTVVCRNAFGPIVYNKLGDAISSYMFSEDNGQSQYTKCIIDNTYDENNNLIKIQSIHAGIKSTKLFDYDLSGNCIKEQYFENNEILFTTIYSYTFRRNKIERIYKNTEHSNGRVMGSTLFKRRVCNIKGHK